MRKYRYKISILRLKTLRLQTVYKSPIRFQRVRLLDYAIIDSTISWCGWQTNEQSNYKLLNFKIKRLTRNCQNQINYVVKILAANNLLHWILYVITSHFVSILCCADGRVGWLLWTLWHGLLSDHPLVAKCISVVLSIAKFRQASRRVSES